MNLPALVGLGLVLGMRHATDPDHVVAVAAIASRTRRLVSAAGIGLMWGVGHTLTIFVAGAAIIVFNLTVPPRVGLSMEFAVGIALAVVGGLNLAGRRRGPSAGSRQDDGVATRLRAFVVGLVHGLAGSAAVALLVLATVRETGPALAYLLVFGLGTVLGMMLVTTSLAAPATWAARRLDARASAGIRMATGALSAGLGLWVMYQTGFVGGLFLPHPHWMAR